MRVAEYPLEQLHWIIRRDPWVRAIFLAAGEQLDGLAERILDAASFEDADTMMARSLALWERLLGIEPEAGATMEQRRADVRALWLAGLPPSLETIQAVCDSWAAGEIEAGYEAAVGTIVLTYQTIFGVPPGRAALIRALDTVKPAHIALEHDYRFLRIKELHRQMSVAEVAKVPLHWFAGGTGQPDRTRGTGILDFGRTLIVRKRSRINIRDDGSTLWITSAGPDYEAPAYEQIGDGLWDFPGALTVAADSRISVRDDGTTLWITRKEDGSYGGSQ